MSEAMEDLGSHLLGRKYEEDSRDWDLSRIADLIEESVNNVAPPTDDILSKTVQEVIDEGTYFSSWAGIRAFWRWLKSLLHHHPTPPAPPSPTPPAPPATAVLWADNDAVLDQGQTPHCVGFGWAQWGNTLPVDDQFTNADGNAIYYEAKVIDGEPHQEDGSSVRSGAKAMQNRGRISAYGFAASLSDVKAWVLAHGPMAVGTDWMNDMFNPDAEGFVKPTGGIAGGHCYALIGYDPETDVFTFLNSWGAAWGRDGRFYMHAADWGKLFSAQGEACSAVELPA